MPPRWSRRALSLLCALAAAGCATQADRYERPPVPAPSRWLAPASDAAWPDSRWWSAFGSPELDALIAQAQLANHDLRMAAARVEQARANARLAFRAAVAGPRIRPQRGAPQGRRRVGRQRLHRRLLGRLRGGPVGPAARHRRFRRRPVAGQRVRPGDHPPAAHRRRRQRLVQHPVAQRPPAGGAGEPRPGEAPARPAGRAAAGRPHDLPGAGTPALAGGHHRIGHPGAAAATRGGPGRARGAARPAAGAGP
jgi:hypothetical protein